MATARRGRGAALALALLLAACQRSGGPERACDKLRSAVAEGDGSALFDWLYEPTQWAFYTVQKNHRQMRELILASYPATEREAALGRLYGSEEGSGRELFAHLYGERYAAAWSTRLGDGPSELRPHPTQPGDYLCGRGDGAFVLRRSASGRWGTAELTAEWEQNQLRAVLDLSTVEKNAELYRRLQPPAAK